MVTPTSATVADAGPDNSEDVTVGMHSPSFDGHRLSTEQEMTIFNHHRVADHYLWTD